MYTTWRAAPRLELYDLEHDPWERVNLADRPEHAGTRDRLLGEATRWQQQTADPLADAKKLAQFVAECEEQARKTGPNKTETEWRYPDYLYR